MSDSASPPAAPASNSARSNYLAVTAGLGLLACLAAAILLALYAKLDNNIGGLVIGLVAATGTTFGNALMSVYNYEFGSSRGSSDKTEQMSKLLTAAEKKP